MATDFSEVYVAHARRHLPWLLRLQIRFAPWVKRWRLLCVRFGSKKVHASGARPEVTARLEAAAAHFQKNKWAFVDDIFSADFHRALVATWPRKRYLEPPRELEKSYNTGFRWVYGDREAFSYSDPYGQYPVLRTLLVYLRSSEMARRVTVFAGVDIELVLYSFILTDAGSGAEVIPHKDSIKDDAREKYSLNFIFFIDATGGKNSGGLMLSRDNELRDIMFESSHLRNTCLVYDILGDFYHGFPPIAQGKFRWVVTAQFSQKDYVEKSP